MEYINNLRLIENSKLIQEMGFKVKLIEKETNRMKNPIIIDTKNDDRLIIERSYDRISAETKDNRKITIDIKEIEIGLLQENRKNNFTWGFNQKLTSSSDTIRVIRKYASREKYSCDLMITNHHRSEDSKDYVTGSILDMPRDLWGNKEDREELLGTTKIVVEPKIFNQRNIIGLENGFIQVFPDRFITATKVGYKGSYDTIKTKSKEYGLESSEQIAETTYKLCKSIFPKNNHGQLEILKSTLESDYSKMLTYSKIRK